MKGASEADLLDGAAEDLRLAIGRLERASRRLHQLVTATGLEAYGEHAGEVQAGTGRLQQVEAAVRARGAVLRASSQGGTT